VSSHVLAELALVADDVVVINHGRLVTQSPTADLVHAGAQRVVVASPRRDALAALIEANGATVDASEGALVATGLSAPAIGELAAAAGLALHELRTEVRSLEEIFLQLTEDGEGIR
jgi:ABC-2 type transport system ATP-binding protein